MLEAVGAHDGKDGYVFVLSSQSRLNGGKWQTEGMTVSESVVFLTQLLEAIEFAIEQELEHTT